MNVAWRLKAAFTNWSAWWYCSFLSFTKWRLPSIIQLHKCYALSRIKSPFWRSRIVERPLPSSWYCATDASPDLSKHHGRSLPFSYITINWWSNQIVSGVSGDVTCILTDSNYIDTSRSPTYSIEPILSSYQVTFLKVWINKSCPNSRILVFCSICKIELTQNGMKRNEKTAGWKNEVSTAALSCSMYFIHILWFTRLFSNLNPFCSEAIYWFPFPGPISYSTPTNFSSSFRINSQMLWATMLWQTFICGFFLQISVTPNIKRNYFLNMY